METMKPSLDNCMHDQRGFGVEGKKREFSCFIAKKKRKKETNKQTNKIKIFNFN
jgi:hypothetical protein